MRFQDIILEPVQEELFCVLVEASRNIPRNQRGKFYFVETLQGSFINHPSLPNFSPDAYKGDIEVLHRVGLVNASYDQGFVFDVLPEGFHYYEFLKGRHAEPVIRTESHSHIYLHRANFQKCYPTAFQKWIEAETLLWGTDSEKQLTTIGHLCREAMQEFATSLVDKHKPMNVDANRAHHISRIKSVIGAKGSRLSSTTIPFLEALINYWGTLSDLVQRQEHGSQREGKPLVWEDARRIVFQTISVFVEIDRALSFG